MSLLPPQLIHLYSVWGPHREGAAKTGFKFRCPDMQDRPLPSLHCVFTKQLPCPMLQLPGNPWGRDLPARQEVFDNCYWKRWRPPRQRVCNAFQLFTRDRIPAVGPAPDHCVTHQPGSYEKGTGEEMALRDERVHPSMWYSTVASQ